MGIRRRKNLALVWLCMAGLVGIVLLQAPDRLPQPPPTTVPVDPPNGGIVVADDELPGSPPFRGYNQVAAARLQTPAKLAEPIRPNPAFSSARTQYTKAGKRAGTVAVINDKSYPVRQYEPTLAPDDPYAAQWWVGQSNLDQAWDIPAGDDPSLLAVIDTGFGLQHEEFAGRWHQNAGETGATASEQPSLLNCTDRGIPVAANCNLVDEDGDGIVDNETGAFWYENPSRRNCSDQSVPLAKACNRIDDDGNGLVDDVTGWDFVNNDPSVQAGQNNPVGSGTTHGTRVASIAAATGDNGKGLAGADWQARILPIQALDDDGYGDTLGVGRAILYAASQGADVISISLGSEFADEYVREAISVAIAGGSIVVASSGNDGCDCMVYPGGFPEVVGVGASDSSGQPAGFSSYGTNLDIIAPGTNMTGATWTQANPTSAYASGIQGTSFSTPLVAGLLSRMRSTQPAATPLQLIAALTGSTDRLSLPATVPRSATLGYGGLDAYAAADRVVTPQTAELDYHFSPVSRGNHLSSSDPAEPPGDYAVQRCEDGDIGTTPLFFLSKGSAYFYSISQAEVWAAQRAGYSSAMPAEICLQQPQDTADSLRIIQLNKEFRNVYGH